MREIWRRFVQWVETAVTLPEDSESIRIRKRTLVIILFITVPITSLWTIALFYMGLWTAALISLGHNIFTILSGIYLFRTRNFIVFQNIWLGTVFLALFSLQTSLGGIIASGVLIIAGPLIAMTAALLLSRRTAVFWAGVSVVGTVLVVALEGRISAYVPAALPSDFSLVNGFFNVLWVTSLTIFLILYLVRELEAAQELADSLLYNVLPKQIAARLKRNQGTIADAYDSASVLFADIVGFTPLSNKLSPTGMIELLNEIYSHFDRLVAKHGAEKIRTIGDNYMVAAGVPTPRPDHAQALAQLALDMQDYCNQMDPIQGHKLQFRIGINSGPVIAGVIGNQRYQFDIWGDAVNTASRMESHALPGTVQITADTKELLGNAFAVSSRGKLEIKGKGEMETWLLEGYQGH